MRVNAEIGGGQLPIAWPSAARTVGEVSKAEDEVSPVFYGDAADRRASHLILAAERAENYVRSIGHTLAQVARPSFPYFRSEDRWAGRGLLGIILAIELGQVGIAVLLNAWNACFYDALQHKNASAFAYELLIFTALGHPAPAVVSGTTATACLTREKARASRVLGPSNPRRRHKTIRATGTATAGCRSTSRSRPPTVTPGYSLEANHL